MSQKRLIKAQLQFELENLHQRIAELEKLNSRHNQIKNLFDDRHLLRIFMQYIPDAIYFKDTEGRFLRINQAQATRLGLADPDEAIGKTDFDFFNPKDAKKAKSEDQGVVRSATVSIRERRKKFSDGRHGWVSATKVPLPDPDGKIIGVFGLTRDITERKNAEKELLKSRDKLKIAKRETDTILKNVEEGLFILDSNYNIGSQYSLALKTIFNEKDLTQKTCLKSYNQNLPKISCRLFRSIWN
jgi:PAS domain S-box-containing protein